LLGIRNARRGKVDSFFVANSLVDKDAVSPFDNAIFFPLYLYPASRQASLFVESTPADVPDGRRCNLTTACTRDVAERLNMHFLYDGRGNLQQNFGPEDIFHYLYALFHSPAYRARYAEFLRIDFPSVPFTSNGLLFCDLCVLGERLVGLHLMERIGTITTRYPEKGNNVIEKVDCTCLASESEKSRVWINETQYFAGIPPEFWDFQIGGYQVCSRWLKDRKGRSLGFHDIQHYQRIVAALAETVTIMGQIDKAVEERGGWPIE
jgi:predicted helicase